MNYYFTGILIILFVLLSFIEPAYPRNEYLNDGTNTCSTGDVSLSIQQRDSENRYRHYDSTNNYNTIGTGNIFSISNSCCRYNSNKRLLYDSNIGIFLHFF